MDVGPVSEPGGDRARIRLSLLGDPGFQVDGGAFQPLPGLPAAFLAHVLLAGRPLSRDHLASLFWPGAGRERALQSVRQTLSRLRGLIPAPVISGQGTLSPAPGPVTLDVEELETALQEGRAADALGLWRGPLLQGFRRSGSWELEDWLERERSRLERRMVLALESAVRASAQEGRLEDAVELVRGGRARFPLEDGLAVLEVQALAAAGRVDEAAAALASLGDDVPHDLREHARIIVARHTGERSPLSAVVPTATPPAPADPGGRPVESPAGGGARTPGARQEGRRPSLPHPLRWLVVAAAGLAAVLLGVAAARSSPDELTLELARSYPDLAVLFCSDRAADAGYPQLYRMSLDGRDKYRVLHEEGCAMVPQPDGSLAGALRHGGPDGENRLARARPNPENPRAEWTVEWLAPDLRDVVAHGSLLPHTGGLIFNATDSSGMRDLFRLLPGHDSVLRLTHDPQVEGAVAVDPDSPDGPVIYERWGGTEDTGDFRDLFATGSDLYAVPLEGGEPLRLTADPRPDRMPQVRGRTVVFVRGAGEAEEEGGMELHLLDLATLQETRLTRNDWNDLGPRMARDGRHLCWQSEEYGHYEMNLRVMELATREERVLVDAPGRDTNCAWTPDGRAVLFTGFRSGDSDVYLVPAEGGAELRLTRLRSSDGAVGAFLDLGAPPRQARR